jgi:threonyl-tRNA synthetase
LEFIEHVYSLFNFKFRYMLSTRPEKYMGDLKLWKVAEESLEQGVVVSVLRALQFP